MKKKDVIFLLAITGLFACNVSPDKLIEEPFKGNKDNPFMAGTWVVDSGCTIDALVNENVLLGEDGTGLTYGVVTGVKIYFSSADEVVIHSPKDSIVLAKGQYRIKETCSLGRLVFKFEKDIKPVKCFVSQINEKTFQIIAEERGEIILIYMTRVTQKNNQEQS